jgi:hypothetical protein
MVEKVNYLNTFPFNNMKNIDLYFVDKEKSENVSGNYNLHPWYVTGYSDGESSFSIRVRRNLLSKLGFHISIVYSLGAERNFENKKLLRSIKNFFNGYGSISKSGNMWLYEVSSIKELKTIRAHFENFPLQTTKIIYFELWCKVMDMIENEEHLTREGFLNILSIKSVFPKGLSKDIIEFYPSVSYYSKPLFDVDKKELNSYWIAGFVQADGTFGLNYTKQNRMTLGYTCQPQLRITQHKRDKIVLDRIIEKLKCGVLVKPSVDRDEYNISVYRIKDLLEIIIPFFIKYPIYGAKSLDFKDFCMGIYIMKDKRHLKLEGLNELKILAYRMNSYRKFK